MKIFLKTSKYRIPITLKDTPTAKAIYDILPLKATANLWGKEIYFEIPLKLNVPKEDLTLTVKIGDVAYWPQGHCFCLFFGPTPISESSEPRPYSEVVIVGKITNKIKDLETVPPNDPLELVKE